MGPANNMTSSKAPGLNVTAADVSSRLASDVRSLDALKRTAKDAPEAAVRQAAKQFEALFMNILMKSMREALPKEDMLASDASRMATGMLDEQWAQTLSGKGLGLAELMMKQLSKSQGGQDAPGTANAPGLMGRTSLLKKLDAANRAVTYPVAVQTPVADGTGDVARTTTPAAPQATGKPGSASADGAPQAFVRRMRDHAVEAQKSSGIPAHFILGQAALESGWGRHEIKAVDGSASHNLFGIKAGRNWTGATVDAITTEYVNGVPRKSVEKFRAYASYGEAFSDYAGLMARNPRYAGVKTAAGDAGVFATHMQAAGYATDPAYARKLTQVINQTLAMQGVA